MLDVFRVVCVVLPVLCRLCRAVSVVFEKRYEGFSMTEQLAINKLFLVKKNNNFLKKASRPSQ